MQVFRTFREPKEAARLRAFFRDELPKQEDNLIQFILNRIARAFAHTEARINTGRPSQSGS